jgi:hypothetical protein
MGAIIREAAFAPPTSQQRVKAEKIVQYGRAAQ